MEIRTRNDGVVETFTISGRMTILDGAEPLRRRFKRSMDAGHRNFLFDLRELLFLDSASIGEMVACLKQAGDQAGSVKLLVSPGGTIDNVIRLSSMDRVFEVLHDVDAEVEEP